MSVELTAPAAVRDPPRKNNSAASDEPNRLSNGRGLLSLAAFVLRCCR